jgi:hypothetical protein
MTTQTTAPPRTLSCADGLRLMQAEYREMPGLHLTAAQARRLWNLDPITCASLLDSLVNAEFLRRTPGGAYVRRDS